MMHSFQRWTKITVFCLGAWSAAVDTASATTFHDISFSGLLRDGGRTAYNGNVVQYLFSISNQQNYVNAIGQSMPDVLAGGNGTSRFDATFRYEELAGGGLELRAVDVGLIATNYIYDLSSGAQGQLVSERARDIWRVRMDSSGEVLSSGANAGEYAVSVATEVNGVVGSFASLNTEYLGVPLEGSREIISLLSDDPASMTVRSGEQFFSFGSLNAAMTFLGNGALAFVWDGLYANLNCPRNACGEGVFNTWAIGNSTGITAHTTQSGQVPEPASALLLTAGLLGLRCRKQTQTEGQNIS